MIKSTPLIEVQSISMQFDNVIALNDVSLIVHAGEVMCLLGDNGAGKSTLMKILSGVFRPTKGKIRIKGKETHLRSPGHAMSKGIATVFQELAMFPLMSITRNFFTGREPVGKGLGPFRTIDWKLAHRVVNDELAKLGIDIRDTNQAVGTLSGGERQCVAIARAIYFGARVLILDEPTSALGVRQTAIVLRNISRAKSRGLGVIFVTHNPQHAYAVGDTFTVLNRGKNLGTFKKDEVDRGTVLSMIAGGQEMEALCAELDALLRRPADSPEETAGSAAEQALAVAFHEEAHRPL